MIRPALAGRRLAAPAVLLLLAGCSAAAQITGLVAGGVAGGATANPAVGYAVAVGTDTVADFTYKYAGRVRQRAEQNAIAGAAAPLQPGDTAPWRIEHTIPFGDEHGTVQVVRQIDTQLAACREIVFSVADKPHPPSWYNSTICRQDFPDGPRWKWALAEPAVERWGFLQ